MWQCTASAAGLPTDGGPAAPFKLSPTSDRPERPYRTGMAADRVVLESDPATDPPAFAQVTMTLRGGG